VHRSRQHRRCQEEGGGRAGAVVSSSQRRREVGARPNWLATRHKVGGTDTDAYTPITRSPRRRSAPGDTLARGGRVDVSFVDKTRKPLRRRSNSTRKSPSCGTPAGFCGSRVLVSTGPHTRAGRCPTTGPGQGRPANWNTEACVVKYIYPVFPRSWPAVCPPWPAVCPPPGL